MIKTLIFACSERDDNLSLKSAKAISKFILGAEIIDLRQYHLQLIGTADESTNANLQALNSKFQEAQQIIFVSPEYNWSVSGNAKNLLDYLSFSKAIWDNKVFMCFGCSAGRGGRLPIIELWTILNKIIAFTQANSIVSSYHLEITANLLNENHEFIESFKDTAQKVFDSQAKIVECFLGKN